MALQLTKKKSIFDQIGGAIGNGAKVLGNTVNLGLANATNNRQAAGNARAALANVGKQPAQSALQTAGRQLGGAVRMPGPQLQAINPRVAGIPGAASIYQQPNKGLVGSVTQLPGDAIDIGKKVISATPKIARAVGHIAAETTKPLIRTGEAVSQGIGNAELALAGRPIQNAQQYKKGNFDALNKFSGYTGTKKQIATDAVQTALTAAAPGLDTAAIKVASKVLPTTAAKVSARVATGAGAGYGTGAAGALGEGANLKQANQAGLKTAAFGGGLGVASVAVPGAARFLKDVNGRPGLAAAERSTGIKARQIVNDNEAGTLRDEAARIMGDKIASSNLTAQQARAVAKNIGLDITSGSPLQRAQRIEQYISQRGQFMKAQQSIGEGGFVRVRGGSDLPEGRPPKKVDSPSDQPLVPSETPQLGQASVGKTELSSLADNTLPQSKSQDIDLDREMQAVLQRGGDLEEAAAIHQQARNSTAGDALAEAKRVANASGLGDTQLRRDKLPEGEFQAVDGKVMKDQRVQDLFQGLATSRTVAGTEANRVANRITQAARNARVNLDQDFIDRFQAGQLATPAERDLGDVIATETDKLFKTQQKLNPNIDYRKNYVPQVYEQGQNAVEDAVNQLRQGTNNAQARVFDTYAQAREYGLTPKFTDISQLVGTTTKNATEALANRQVVQNGLESGLLSTDRSGGKMAVNGFFNADGQQIYAQKSVAQKINNAFEESGSILSKIAKGSKEVNVVAQDVMLAGGIPFTPINAFTMSQVIKELTAGRISIAKDVLYSFSPSKTAARFARNQDLVDNLAQRGLNLRNASSLHNIEGNGFTHLWNDAVNRPTFEQFMPNQYLTVAQNTFKSASKHMSADEAYQLAADTTKRYYGIVDELAKGRSKDASNAIGAAFFAPKYRESIINTLFNTGKSIIDPRTYGDKAYNLNRRLAAGMAVSWVGYELANKAITGHYMNQNRPGQGMSLEIPYGEKDAKGNQKTVNIPFMPSFLTVPRSAINAVTNAVEGRNKDAFSELTRNLSAPLQTTGQLASNRDYFGRPIYNDQATAELEGINKDSPLQTAGKSGAYVVSASAPGPVRAVINQLQGKPTEQNIANALEAPVRFGKRYNAETTSYFEERDKQYNKLSPQAKRAYDALHPAKVNGNRDRADAKTIQDPIFKAATYLKFPEVLAADNAINKRSGVKDVDPFYRLSADKQKAYLQHTEFLPGSAEARQWSKDNASWYNDFAKARGTFFDKLPASTTPGKPQRDTVEYPDVSPAVQKQMDAYSAITDSAEAASYIQAHPDVSNQFSRQAEYTNKVRIARGAKALKGYPTPDKQTQADLETYNQLPQHNGPQGGSPDRFKYLQSHPNITDYFSQSALYSLDREAALDQFEGNSPSQKQLKNIYNLGKYNVQKNPDGTYTLGSSSSSSGGGSGGHKGLSGYTNDATVARNIFNLGHKQIRAQNIANPAQYVTVGRRRGARGRGGRKKTATITPPKTLKVRAVRAKV